MQSLQLQHTQLQQLQHDNELTEAVLATTTYTHSDTTTTTWWGTNRCSPCNYNTLSYNNYNMIMNWQRVLATTTYTHSDTTTTTWWGTNRCSPCNYNTLSYNNYNMIMNWRRQSLRLQHTLTQIQQLQHDEELTDAVLATTTHSVTTTTTW